MALTSQRGSGVFRGISIELLLMMMLVFVRV